MSLDDTLRRLPPGAVEFARSLFDRHWMEASWLYERRETLSIQGALVSAGQWLAIEERADAHVAALHRGGRMVFEDCEARALHGDVGELDTALRLLARADRGSELVELVDAIDWYQPARAHAVSDALVWDAPDHWQGLVGSLLADETIPEDAIGPLATVVGARRWPLGGPLCGVLERGEGDLEAIAWAVGRLGLAEALPQLYALVEGPFEPRVRQAAALAALRFAPGEVLAFLRHVVAAEDWAAVPLALGGGADAWEPLSAVARRSPTAERLLAVGLHGCPSGIDLLLDALDRPEAAGAAAEALYLLLGAPLHQPTREPVYGDEPRLDDDPLDAVRPTGLMVSRLPRSRSVWSAWLDEHGSALRSQAGPRLRMGAPFEPQRSIDELGRTTTSPRVRRWMVEELAIRYRITSGPWPRLRQSMVRATLLETLEELARLERTQKLVPGVWYRAAQPLRTVA